MNIPTQKESEYFHFGVVIEKKNQHKRTHLCRRTGWVEQNPDEILVALHPVQYGHIAISNRLSTEHPPGFTILF